MDRHRGGHAVLAVPVPQLEWFVRGRWEHYAPELVSTDPAFTHAHVTALAPYLAEPSPAELAAVAAIAAATEPFDFVLGEVAAFPDGIVHLRPEPLEPFAQLTARLWEAFPRCPPYAGEFADSVPHLTLDLLSEDVTLAGTRALLGDGVPVRCRAERLELHWYETGNCHVRASWALGAAHGVGQSSVQKLSCSAMNASYSSADHFSPDASRTSPSK